MVIVAPLKPGRPVGCIGLLDCLDFDLSKVQFEGCDGLGEMTRLGGADDRGGDNGVTEHPRQRDLGHADAARLGDLLDGVNDRLIEGRVEGLDDVVDG